MPKFITENETINPTLYVYGAPGTKLVREDGVLVEKEVIDYSIYTFDLSSIDSLDDKVFILKQDVDIDIPGGLDLRKPMVEQLRKQQDKIRAKAEMEVNQLQGQIERLIALEHIVTE